MEAKSRKYQGVSWKTYYLAKAKIGLVVIFEIAGSFKQRSIQSHHLTHYCRNGYLKEMGRYLTTSYDKYLKQKKMR